MYERESREDSNILLFFYKSDARRRLYYYIDRQIRVIYRTAKNTVLIIYRNSHKHTNTYIRIYYIYNVTGHLTAVNYIRGHGLRLTLKKINWSKRTTSEEGLVI